MDACWLRCRWKNAAGSIAARLVLLILAPLCGISAQQPSPDAPASLAPTFLAGQVLRYQLEFRSALESRTAGLLESPQAPSRRELSVAIVLRLDVLPGTTPQAARLRATYESTAATVTSELFDPDNAELEEQYRSLQGRAIEFTVDAAGGVRDIRGLQELLADTRSLAEAEQLLAQLAGAMPGDGKPLVPGAKWSSEKPVPDAPLAGVAWRTETTYVRDEACPESPAGEMCALILGRSELTQARRSDPTPEDFRKRGLRTSGRVGGRVESLSYISRRTGLLASATQTVSEEADFFVYTPDRESTLRYTSRLDSRSHIQLLSVSSVRP